MSPKRKVDGKIGARLAELRKLRGISQTWLAKRMGISTAAIQSYENSRCRIPSDRLQDLIDILKCDPSDLIKPRID